MQSSRALAEGSRLHEARDSTCRSTRAALTPTGPLPPPSRAFRSRPATLFGCAWPLSPSSRALRRPRGSTRLAQSPRPLTLTKTSTFTVSTFCGPTLLHTRLDEKNDARGYHRWSLRDRGSSSGPDVQPAHRPRLPGRRGPGRPKLAPQDTEGAGGWWPSRGPQHGEQDPTSHTAAATTATATTTATVTTAASALLSPYRRRTAVAKTCSDADPPTPRRSAARPRL